MFAFSFILLVAIVNFGIGFGLALHLGHGPPWIRLPSPNAIRRAIQSAGKPATTAAHTSRH